MGADSIGKLIRSGFASRSIRVRIGLLYVVLALLNITFFSLSTFQNQTDLLVDKFFLRSEKLVSGIRGRLSEVQIGPEQDQNFDFLRSVLEESKTSLTTRESSIEEGFIIFNKSGSIIHRVGDVIFGELGSDGKLHRVWLEKALGIMDRNKNHPKNSKEIERAAGDSSNLLYMRPYHIELNTKDFRTTFILPLQTLDAEEKYYLKTELSLDEIQDRLYSLYWRIALGVSWGVVFHLLFAIFIVRLFIRRIDKLTVASERMEQGDLNARVEWDFRQKDEIDVMGLTFNRMAEKIESTVKEISHLNLINEKELRLGKKVQENFLSPPEIIERFKPTIYYQPLREVSGDFYRFFDEGRGTKSIFFADATGHGVPAALITSVAFLALENIKIRGLSSPTAICEELNIVLTESLDTEYYMTGVLFLIEENNIIKFTNAGHPAPLIYRPSSGEVFEISAGDPPLGLVDEYKFTEDLFEGQKGDKVFIYSDGLYETENESGDLYGMERLVATFRFMCESHQDNDEIMKGVLSHFAEFVHEYNDDVSAILLEL